MLHITITSLRDIILTMESSVQKNYVLVVFINNSELNFVVPTPTTQNGIAEHHIRSITEHARTMLIHAKISWPDIISNTLWPFALHLAIDIYNNTPNQSGLSPTEIFTGVKSHSN
jgi:hypothetical protein